MPKALADRLSSRAERRLNKVYPTVRPEREAGTGSPSPISPISFDTAADPDSGTPYQALVHRARFGHLPVTIQIDAIEIQIAEERRQKRRERFLIEQSFRPIRPARLPRPPTVPIAAYSRPARVAELPPPTPKKPTLAERLAAAPAALPIPRISRPADLSFERKTPREIHAIVGNKIDATIVRLQAIFDKKPLFDELPADHQRLLHKLGDYLNWASDETDNSHTWAPRDRQSLIWACTSIGKVDFSLPSAPLSRRYRQVAQELVYITQGGYLQWIDEFLPPK